MSYGYWGRVLRVDLSEGRIWVEEPGDEVYRSCLGGSALALYYLLRENKPGVDPLGPDNLLVFAPSVLNGTPGPGMSRYTVAARSPLTGALGEAEAGGWWGPELKMAGFDAVVITGQSPEPVYLYIKDGEASLRDAQAIWGLETAEAQAAIRRELGDEKVRIAQIGPAGEKLVRYACVLNELKHANGRSGLGAVMGSKRLRAIAVRGTMKVPLHDPERVEGVRKKVLASYKRTPGDMHDLGTSGGVPFLDARGMLPTRNFRRGQLRGCPGDQRPGHAGYHPHRPGHLLRLLHRLQARGEGGRRLPGGSRLRRPGVRDHRLPGLAVRGLRPGGRGPGQPAVQRPGAGHHLRGHHHRLRHGVLREGPPDPGGHRRRRAALRQRRGHAGDDRAHRPAQGSGRPAGRGRR